MGNFAENLNLGNRFRPPCIFFFIYLQLSKEHIIEKELSRNHVSVK